VGDTLGHGHDKENPTLKVFAILLLATGLSIWIGIEIGPRRDPLAWAFLLAAPGALLIAIAVRLVRTSRPKDKNP
jgi:hypothetical protein